MAKAKESQPKPGLYAPMQRSSSVSASPINSNLKSLSEWANFRWAAERSGKKDGVITWVLVSGQGSAGIDSSSDGRAVELSSTWAVRRHNPTPRPRGPSSHPGTLWWLVFYANALGWSRCGRNIYIVPGSTFPFSTHSGQNFPDAKVPAMIRSTHTWQYLPRLDEIQLAAMVSNIKGLKAQSQPTRCP